MLCPPPENLLHPVRLFTTVTFFLTTIRARVFNGTGNWSGTGKPPESGNRTGGPEYWIGTRPDRGPGGCPAGPPRTAGPCLRSPPNGSHISRAEINNHTIGIEFIDKVSNTVHPHRPRSGLDQVPEPALVNGNRDDL